MLNRGMRARQRLWHADQSDKPIRAQWIEADNLAKADERLEHPHVLIRRQDFIGEPLILLDGGDRDDQQEVRSSRDIPGRHYLGLSLHLQRERLLGAQIALVQLDQDMNRDRRLQPCRIDHGDVGHDDADRAQPAQPSKYRTFGQADPFGDRPSRLEIVTSNDRKDAAIEGIKVGAFRHIGHIDDGFQRGLPEVAASRHDRIVIIAP